MFCGWGWLDAVFGGGRPPAVRLIFVVFVDDGGRLEGCYPKKPTPGRARRQLCFVSSKRRRVGEDDVICSTRLDIFVSMVIR